MTCPRAVIFDLDDTLYPESTYVDSGLQCVSKWLSTELVLDATQVYSELKQLHVESHQNVFDRWLAQNSFPDVQALELVQIYREHEPQLEPFQSVPQLLSNLTAAKFRLGLLSDGYLAVQQRKWASLGLEGHFSSVVFSDEFGREKWKPHALPYETAIRELEIQPSAGIYVADNPAKDFLGARRAGLKSIRYRFVGGVYSSLEPETEHHRPDLEISDLSQLTKVVGQLH